MHEDIIKLLVQRGIDTDEAIEKFINVGQTQLHNPFLLKNMDIVVEKIKYYMTNNKRQTRALASRNNDILGKCKRGN